MGTNNMPTQDRLIFKHAEEDLYVSAYAPYTDEWAGTEVQMYIGCFRIGEEEFNINSSTNFLTRQDLLDIANTMGEWND